MPKRVDANQPQKTLYPDWLAKREGEIKLPRSIRVMHAKHGVCAGHTCGECSHLIGISYANTYYKCNLTAMTHGPGTDFRKKWPACGAFDLRVPGVVIRTPSEAAERMVNEIR